MGFFDSVKLMFGDKLLDEIIAVRGLAKFSAPGSVSRNPYPRLWTGTVDGWPVSLEQGVDKNYWYLTAGKLGPDDSNEEESILLERMDPLKREEPDPEIDKYVAWAGPAAVEQYLIAGQPDSGDYSALKNPAMARCLPAFSKEVDEVDIYFRSASIVIHLKREGLERIGFEQDLGLAIELSRALGG